MRERVETPFEVHDWRDRRPEEQEKLWEDRLAFDCLDETKWENPASCKVMWGGADLYRLTGDARVLAVVEQLLQNFVASQFESGLWVHSLWYESPVEQPFSAALDLVQESKVERPASSVPRRE